MPSKDPFSEHPRELRAGTGRSSALYVRKPGYYAVHDRQPDAPAPGSVALLNEGAIAVFQGQPDQAAGASTAGTLGPVYELQPGGALAVPTGLVFVRFADTINAESRVKE